MDSIRTVVGVFLLVCFGVNGAGAATLYVGPSETCATIQSGIDAAVGGDVVIVRDGTYTGPGNQNISFGGKAIMVRSEKGPASCIVDLQGKRNVCGFLFVSGEGLDSQLDGFTITGGFAYDGAGGGIQIVNSSPTISNNLITRNRAYYGGGGIYASGSALFLGNTISLNTSEFRGGGGIYFSSGSPLLISNAITGNAANSNAVGRGGGGIYIGIGGGATLSLVGNTIAENAAYGSGGGVLVFSGSVVADNNIIIGNSAGGAENGQWGGGIRIYGSDAAPPFMRVANCILRGNYARWGPQLACRTGAVSLSYSNLHGGRGAIDGNHQWGAGNIDVDPLFADPANGDYHMKSAYGRWDLKANAGAGDWVLDDVTSPCINAGDPASDFSQQPQPSRRIEIGAYGNTPEASKGKWVIPGDANGDSRVDVTDLIFLRNRLGQNVGTGDNWKADVNEDGRINVLDLIFARNRLGTRRD